MSNIKKKIGFIGQGWVGKNYADVFENLGFSVVRYSQEPLYVKNKDKISLCDIVFIAVPTPTTVKGFDDSIVRKVIKLVGKGEIAVIKSTMLPGTTVSIQKKNPKIFVIREALSADSRIGKTHLDPIHKSGRGAGGHCFIKVFASFRRFYEKKVGDKKGIDALKFVEIKNIELLKKSNKDIGLLKGVYGKNF